MDRYTTDPHAARTFAPSRASHTPTRNTHRTPPPQPPPSAPHTPTHHAQHMFSFAVMLRPLVTVLPETSRQATPALRQGGWPPSARGFTSRTPIAAVEMRHHDAIRTRASAYRARAASSLFSGAAPAEGGPRTRRRRGSDARDGAADAAPLAGAVADEGRSALAGAGEPGVAAQRPAHARR